MKLGVIVDGVYYKGDKEPEKDKRAVTDKQYGFDMQRKNHQRDLIQPFVDGKPNEKFIEQYPNESIDYGFIKK